MNIPGYGLTSAANGTDGFVIRYEPAGTYVWNNLLSSAGQDIPYSVCFNLDEPYISATYDYNNYVAHLNKSTGAEIWSWSVYTGGITADVVTDGNNLFATGHFTSTRDFDPGSGTFDLMSNGGDDIFTLELDLATGAFVHAMAFGIGGGDDVGLAATAPSSNVTFVGTIPSPGNLDMDPDTGSTVLANGNFAAQYGINPPPPDTSDTTGTWVGQIQNVDDLVAYPNPVMDHITLQFTLADSKDLAYTIYTVEGRIVKSSGFVKEQAGAIIRKIDLSELDLGSYLVQIADRRGAMSTLKLLKLPH